MANRNKSKNTSSTRDRESDRSNGRNNNRGKGKPVRDRKGQYRNDPNFYFTDSTLIDQLASFSFDEFVGVPIDIHNPFHPKSGGIEIASWMNIYMKPSAGYAIGSDARSAGINVAGFQLYTKLSSINAKTTNYQPHDLSMMLLALGSLLAYVGWMRRCFGIAFLVNQRNRTVPRDLLQSQIRNADDFVKNMAAYRIRFNYILSTIQRIPFPTNISYFAKCSTLFSNLYVDGGTGMSQMYIPTPASVWEFDEESYNTGSVLQDVNLLGMYDFLTFADHLDQLERMVNALVNSSTLNYVYSDILNLAAKENVPLYTMELQPENYVVLPIYNENMLVMINNLTITGMPIVDVEDITEHELTAPSWFLDGQGTSWTSGNMVFSDPDHNVVNYAPVFKNDFPVAGCDVLLNYPVENPSVDLRVESTRLTHAGKAEAIYKDDDVDGTIDSYLIHDVALPDWYCCRMTVNPRATPITESGYYAVNTAIHLMTQFDYHPRLWHVMELSTKGFAYIDAVFGDLNYCTTVDREYLKKVHDTAMLGLFTLR